MSKITRIDLKYNTPKQVENFVLRRFDYISSLISENIAPELKLVSIKRNPFQGIRRSIYDLKLSDGSMLAMKLVNKTFIDNSVMSEVNGFNYAQTMDIPSPKVFYYEKKDNPLNLDLMIMQRLDIVPIKEFFKGETSVILSNEELFMDSKKLVAHVDAFSDILHKFHSTKFTQKWPYNEDRFLRLFKGYEHALLTEVSFKESGPLTERLKELREEYIPLEKYFIASPLCNIHGDPDITNLVHTRTQESILMDFEHFRKGDSAQDISYFIKRNVLIPKDSESQIGKICELYMSDDPLFNVRLGLYMHLTNLWHVIMKSEFYKKEDFLNLKLPEFLKTEHFKA